MGNLFALVNRLHQNTSMIRFWFRSLRLRVRLDLRRLDVGVGSVSPRPGGNTLNAKDLLIVSMIRPKEQERNSTERFRSMTSHRDLY